MRKTLLFLLLLSVKLTFGQFYDNFIDGNFTVNPIWTGQTSLFTVNSNKQLNSLLSSVSQVISLSTESELALNVAWEFSVQLDFDPSTTNFTRIYLISDQADLKGNLNGYFIQIGESGSADSYDLYKQTGSSVTKILDGLPKNRANINFLSTKLRITRDDFGRWEVYTSVDDGANYMLEGSAIDKTFVSTSWFGVYCKYTATRSDGFKFDDFKVEELVVDKTPPSLIAIKIADEFTMEVIFSEAIMPGSALIANNYLIKELNEVPVSVSLTTSPHIVKLNFTKAFPSGSYTLVVNDIGDLKGNSLKVSQATTFYVQPYIAIKNDLIINEVFADPLPTIGLPTAEFVELWNTTNRYILLKDWKYKDLISTYTFLSDTLRPNEYAILCAATDVNLFKKYGKTIGLSTWPSLNNDKDKLSLINAQGTIIDEVFYTDNWYKDAIKKQGGYSLELNDPTNKCSGVQNWQGSNNGTGGTPGSINSVFGSQLSSTSPKLVTAFFIDETTIKVDFDKPIDSISGALIDNYKLNNGIGSPLIAIPQPYEFSSVLLKLNTSIIKGQEYILTIDGISDCAGNIIGPTTTKLFLAKDIGKNDILISEVLVNPRQGGVDFIEIYNATDHVLDLSTLKLANTDANGNVGTLKNISTNTVYIPSRAFWVLTSNIEIIKQQYDVKNPTHFTEMIMPPYTNEKGTVILQGLQGEVDRFGYHEKMHFPLLQIVKGVSLERVSYLKPANEKDNFKSAAQASGFATPTAKNSHEENIAPNNTVWLSTKVFSPDGDGVEDLLQINYEFANQEYLANVNVYNDKGMLVKRLVKNNTIPNVGSFSWDGLNDGGSLSKIGIYIVKFEVFALNGRVRSYEQACVLAMRLN